MPFRLPSAFCDFADPSCRWLWVALLAGLLALLLAGAALAQSVGSNPVPNALGQGCTGQVLSTRSRRSFFCKRCAKPASTRGAVAAVG
jgi:hypothetical protein